MDGITETSDGRRAPTSEPRRPGHRYATPTGDPCPRTVHVDGTIENDGNCQSCGMCLLFGGLVELPDVSSSE
jgi:hypothetical protein